MFSIKVVVLFVSFAHVIEVALSDDSRKDRHLEDLLKRFIEARNSKRFGGADLFGNMSGIEVDAEVQKLYDDIKHDHAYPWAIFKINPQKTRVIVDAKGARGYSDFLDALMASGEPRYAIFDTPKEWGGEKLAFISWCLDDANIGLKMIYASSKDTLKKKFEGLSIEMQITNKNQSIKEELIKGIAKNA
ncbi:actin-depolymerizing factor 7-like [Acanthaster planci]|uniref:Actin-depolymerizing factor 7-like n=1 Tax=Acanthaster planci TaxID=133434 RepID=A0A8B7YWA2_ACAPL|nr:actin-depolymerizing factor 7-like [Acanthaster planci]XP_022096963.1 actin-depolymerizing factor 7-like [Acanthaster planci]XP_022096964.1 actin-depolymerizing factor 7-like [Acanthaster planci]